MDDPFIATEVVQADQRLNIVPAVQADRRLNITLTAQSGKSGLTRLRRVDVDYAARAVTCAHMFHQ